MNERNSKQEEAEKSRGRKVNCVGHHESVSRAQAHGYVGRTVRCEGDRHKSPAGVTVGCCSY